MKPNTKGRNRQATQDRIVLGVTITAVLAAIVGACYLLADMVVSVAAVS